MFLDPGEFYNYKDYVELVVNTNYMMTHTQISFKMIKGPK